MVPEAPAPAPPAQPTRQPGPGWAALWSGALTAAAAIAAHAPLLLLVGSISPTERLEAAVPTLLILAVAGALGWRRAGRLGDLRAVPADRALLAFAAPITLLTLAVLLLSAWLAQVAGLLAIPAALFAVGGKPLARAALPAGLLLGMTLPLPLGLSGWAQEAQQAIASRGAGAVLDLLGVPFLPTGYVLEVPGKRLFVEEACSGTRSLWVALTAALAFGLWNGLGPARLGLGLLATAAWALLANVTRIAIVAVGWARFGLDLSEGWPHELLSLIALAATLGLALSTDACLAAIEAQWIAWREQRQRQRVFANPLSDLFPTHSAVPENLAAGDFADQPVGQGPTRLTGTERLAPPAWWIAGIYLVLALTQVALIGPQRLLGRLDGPGHVAATLPPLAMLGEDALPAHVRSLDRISFREVRRGRHDSNGEHSRFWTYRMGPYRLTASIDYPFAAWHELTNCYRNQGWTIDRRLVRATEGGPLVDAELTDSTGRFGSLRFGVYDGQGGPQVPPEWVAVRASRGALVDRLAARTTLARWHKLIDDAAVGGLHQVQVFVEGPRSLTAEERAEVERFFEEFRRRVHDAGSATGGDQS